MKHRKIVIVALITLTGAPIGAHAQSSTAQAEALFRQGKDLIAHSKIAEACAAFDASQKLDPTIATLLNQASCREKTGQLATAWGLFLDAERQSRSASDEAARQLHQVAINHAAKLEPRLSTLTITVLAENRVGGLEILRNSDPGATGEASNATGVNGDQANDRALSAGAVYVFVRSGSLCWRGLRVRPPWAYMDSAGIHQGVKHRGIRQLRLFGRAVRRHARGRCGV